MHWHHLVTQYKIKLPGAGAADALAASGDFIYRIKMHWHHLVTQYQIKLPGAGAADALAPSGDFILNFALYRNMCFKINYNCIQIK